MLSIALNGKYTIQPPAGLQRQCRARSTNWSTNQGAQLTWLGWALGMTTVCGMHQAEHGKNGWMLAMDHLQLISCFRRWDTPTTCRRHGSI
jgi:hypothetical protein